MAFVEEVKFSEETEEEIFMVSYSVGANAANGWTDIQLVQYLIGNIYLYAVNNPSWRGSDFLYKPTFCINFI